MTKSKLDSFSINQTVQYKDQTGFITFIDSAYITICVKEWDKTPEQQRVSRHPKHQCNLLVFPHDYDKVKLIHIG